MTKDEGIQEVLKEMEAMTPEQLRADLDKHKDGQFAIALREAGKFFQEMEDEAGKFFREMEERSNFMAMVNK